MRASNADVETGEEYKAGEEENEALLPTHARDDTPLTPRPASSWPSLSQCSRSFTLTHLLIAFASGALACVVAQYSVCGSACFTGHAPQDAAHVLAPPYVGSTEVHNWPPPTATNNVPTLFPSDVGHAGATPTGAEPALIATAPSYPLHTGAPQLIVPQTLHSESKPKQGKKNFDLFKHWGNLSPWYSVKKGAFGVDSGPEAPDGCSVTGLHFLHRHGARYPTSWAAYGGPATLAHRLHETAASWTAKDDLEFLNGWSYKLGEEVLTPFGRQQLFDLGISIRLKYGFLLENFTDSLPVFRTESQDRMLASALNFASGFFGIPYEDKYLQSITIEDDGFNNTLAPYKTCPNTGDRAKADRGTPFVKEWAALYLKDARDRLQSQIHGYDLTIEDVYIMQQMCPYETVAIGFSKFCGLFTQEEWEGFDYAMDIYFWYDSAFGSPVARVQGIGYIQEMVARLTHTPIETHNSSTNSTLNDNPVTFPLDHNLYVDATHEVVVLNIITALNLTNFAKAGPLPTDHIPAQRPFRVSQLAPFSTNIQFQLLSCPSRSDEQLRVIINDAVSPLTGIEGCPEDADGMCSVPTFVAAQKKIIANTDWVWACHGDWDVPAGHEWNTTTGDAPGVIW
ncbi:phosphoglycerate mutase-like protein [Artomyces pyxidatus]|uniref:Phosphoglycerate mutase-like protein n=1 Tax=Artomyces pyxidatus TaxID=48021 RepID=A0ACB8SKJ8_9AGAM|nr:phosphoglycerate mutase-like protein [Artomyces pyxidatus]